MNAFPPIEPPPVRAINVQTDARRSAYAVVDALDELEHQLGAYRALAALTAVNLADTPERWSSCNAATWRCCWRC